MTSLTTLVEKHYEYHKTTTLTFARRNFVWIQIFINASHFALADQNKSRQAFEWKPIANVVNRLQRCNPKVCWPGRTAASLACELKLHVILSKLHSEVLGTRTFAQRRLRLEGELVAKCLARRHALAYKFVAFVAFVQYLHAPCENRCVADEPSVSDLLRVFT